jgi:hypothetical protein
MSITYYKFVTIYCEHVITISYHIFLRFKVEIPIPHNNVMSTADHYYTLHRAVFHQFLFQGPCVSRVCWHTPSGAKATSRAQKRDLAPSVIYHMHLLRVVMPAGPMSCLLRGVYCMFIRMQKVSKRSQQNRDALEARVDAVRKSRDPNAHAVRGKCDEKCINVT